MAHDNTLKSDPGAWVRLKNRVRFGLATQELLDRIARFGLVIYPYFIVDEPVRARPELEGMDEGLQTRELQVDDAPLIASLAERTRDEATIRAMMARATCVAIMENDDLLGYSWFTRDQLRGIAGTNPMVELPPDCAYLFDLFVRRSERGRNLAVLLRNAVHKMLAAQGVKHAYSISLAFNRSTRRFKAKLGAVEVELRLFLRLKPFRALDLRLRRKPWLLSTPALHVSLPREIARS
jgi:GNAT superfamily N-acetyltransferase